MIAVSACLLGENCKYNGSNNKNQKVLDFLKDKKYVAICPEMLGGLPCPRIPSEIKDGQVFSKEGKNVTREFKAGAKRALEIVLNNGCDLAILKESSPSCGVNTVYNGEFTNTKINGSGITAALFKKMGIKVISEKDV